MDDRFTALDLGDGSWAVFDIESTFEDQGEAYISYWSGEAENSEDAIRLAKEAWGCRQPI